MQKLTSDEFDALKIFGKGSSSPLYVALVKLNVGDALLIKKNEWNRKYPPTVIMSRVERKYGYKLERGALVDRSGWAVRRVK